LKRATTTTKMKVAEVRAEAKTIGTADLKRIIYAVTSVAIKWQKECFI